MSTKIETSVRQDIAGDEQRIGNLNTDYNAITFKHILLPIWISAYQYNGKVYRFIINGRTGKLEGERPFRQGTSKQYKVCCPQGQAVSLEYPLISF